MVVGVVCGYYVPNIQEKLSVLSIEGTSLPIAIGLWLMMWPVLAKVRLENDPQWNVRGRALYPDFNNEVPALLFWPMKV